MAGATERDTTAVQDGPRGNWARTGALGLCVAAAWWMGTLSGDQHPPAEASEPTARLSTIKPPAVTVIRPQAGGLVREVTETGSVEAYEAAALYARVSGYLRTIAVEIGDRVTRGQVLAEIDAPELEKEVERCAALLAQAKSRVLQAQARVKAAEAQEQAARAAIAQADASIHRCLAKRSYREKEFGRIEQLAAKQAVELRLVDEKRHQVEEARAGQQYADAAAEAARAEHAACLARTEQARADLTAAQADVRVAAAELDRVSVMNSYTQIASPYDGVITERNYDRGAFIRAAGDGAELPLLHVARTDQMRVVVQIPDGDVPFVRAGDQTRVQVAALGGATFLGTVSRVSFLQDRRTRTMRAEIDLPNPDGRLSAGMYGAVTIVANTSAKGLTIPVSCLVDPPRNGKGTLCVVRDGRAMYAPVGIGRCDSARVEILGGIGPEDYVMLDGDVPFESGDEVVAVVTPLQSEPLDVETQTADLR